MNDFIRYKAIGCSFYGLKQEDVDDILDVEHFTWTETQLEYDLLNKVLPVGLLLIDIDEKVYRIVCTRVPHGHKHSIEAVIMQTKGLNGQELVQDYL